MFRSLKQLEGYTAEGINGEAGHVKDFYFDDEDWVIRHIVVEYPTEGGSHYALIAPNSLTSVDRGLEAIYLMLTRQQVQEYCPSADSDLPVSRQQAIHRAGDPHLRSAQEVQRYRVQAFDGSMLGSVCDLLVNDRNWQVDAIAVSTRSGLTRVTPQQISTVNCGDKTMHIASDKVPELQTASAAMTDRS